MADYNSRKEKYRFIKHEQIRFMKNLSFPAIIVPVGVAKDAEETWELTKEWQFVTNEGLIPAPKKWVFDELLNQVHTNQLTWRFVPKASGTTICVAPTAGSGTDKEEAMKFFEKWLVEHSYPFDRIEQSDYIDSGDVRSY